MMMQFPRDRERNNPLSWIFLALVGFLWAGSMTYAAPDDLPVLSPEVSALRIDVDGDGVCTEEEKIFVQLLL